MVAVTLAEGSKIELVEGDCITARRARNGETVEALNGKTYTLDTTMTAMADDRKKIGPSRDQ